MSGIAIPGALAEETTADVSAKPYAPSFIDSFTDRVDRLAGPYWLFYLGCIAALILLHSSIKWLDGSLPFGSFLPRVLLADISFIYTIWMLHYLDKSAHEALDEFHPIMQIDAADFAKLRYSFTTMRARPALFVALLGLAYGSVSMFFLSPGQINDGRFFSSPPATLIEVALFVLSYLGEAVFLYHCARQLRMINSIYANYAHVDLFNLRPMHAFSKLTARTALAFGVIIYAWVYVNFAVQNGPGLPAPSLLEPALFTFIVVFIFIVPLLGARRLLHLAKAKALLDAQQQFKATVAELHHRREAGDFSEMGGINDALDGLLKEQTTLNKISTWPWQPETVQGVATAVLLPIFVWAITRLLDSFWPF